MIRKRKTCEGEKESEDERKGRVKDEKRKGRKRGGRERVCGG